MSAWSRRHTLFAGLALILVVNAIALAGVALNRAGEPDSLVQLSERELKLPYGRMNSQENSGVALDLRWRVYTGNELPDSYDEYGSYGGSAAWLDEPKMVALGFELPQAGQSARWINRPQRTKEVWLVLEHDGAAYRQTLERARKRADEEEKRRAANPGDKEFEHRAKSTQASALSEATENSRLFVIDAGLDSEALRAAYPDRTHYLIAQGQIRSQIVTRDKHDRLDAYVSALSVGRINVPVEFQQALTNDEQTDKPAHFEAKVAYGKRLEPWLVALTAVREHK